jgi:RNA polymerase sigma-70 factor (ECF subfamily)
VSFEAIYREHFATIWRAVRRFGVSERDAADAAQEVFVIAHRRFHEFEGRSTLRTWLFGIAFRVAASRRRHSSATREVLAFETADMPPDSADNPETAAMRRELRGLLQQGLDALPLEQRAVFILFELEGLSGEQIAEALGQPEGTVRSRLRLARATFSKVVKRALGRAQQGEPERHALAVTHD